MAKYNNQCCPPQPGHLLVSDEFGSKRSSCQSSSVADILSNAGQSQLFTKVGYYNGRLVAIKQIQKSYIYLTKDVIHSLNLVRHTDYMNSI